MKTNPMLAAASAAVSEAADGAPKYIKKTAWPAPLCFITGDSWHTSVTAEETNMRYNVTLCELPVAQGAGYSLVQLPHSHATSFGITSTTLCLCITSGAGFVATRPTNFTHRSPLTSAQNLEDFLARLWKFVPLQQGHTADVPWAAPPAHGAAQKVTQCGCKSRSLKAHANGQLVLEDVEKGLLLSSRHVRSAALADFTYVQYHRAPFLQALCCGKQNEVQVSFLGDRYTMETQGTSDAELDAFHLGLQAAQLGGRPPGAPLRVIDAKEGSRVIIGPEFTTVEVASCAWAGPACKTTEIATVRTSDINYFKASLPSWINALITTLRDFQLFKCAKEVSRCLTDDLLLLPVWPVAFAYRSWVVLGLALKFLSSLVTFLLIFFFRATTITLGGPQGPRPVTLPMAEEHPERLLREISAAVARAQELHQWERAARAPLRASSAVAAVAQQQQPAPPQQQQMTVQQQFVPMQELLQLLQDQQLQLQLQRLQQQQQNLTGPALPGSYYSGASRERSSLPPGRTKEGPNDGGQYWFVWSCARQPY